MTDSDSANQYDRMRGFEEVIYEEYDDNGELVTAWKQWDKKPWCKKCRDSGLRRNRTYFTKNPPPGTFSLKPCSCKKTFDGKSKHDELMDAINSARSDAHAPRSRRHL